MASGLDGSIAGAVTVQVVDDQEASARGVMSLLQACDQLLFLDPVLDVDSVDPSADVVVCDLHLRGAAKSGAAAVRFIVTELERPVVATSGAVGCVVVGNAMGAGASSYIGKEGSFPAALWADVIAAAAIHKRYMTSQLAEKLLADRRLRPLVDDFTNEAVDFLREVFDEADSLLTRHRRHPSDARVAAVQQSIWRVARRRWEAYRFESDRERQICLLLAEGVSEGDIAKILSLSSRYIGDLVQELLKKFKAIPGAMNSPLASLKPASLARRLAEMDAQERGVQLFE